MGRNRQQRRGTTVYRLEPMFRPDARRPVLATGPEHYLEGEIGDCLVVSVPPTTSYESCRQLREQLCAAFARPDSRVLIITHNIEFLRVKRLTATEAARLIREVDDPSSANRLDEPAPTEATA